MKKQGILTLATVSAVALCLGTVLPSHAQGQEQGRRGGGQGRGQGRGGPGGFGGGQFGRGGMMGMFNDPTTSSKLMLLQRDDVRTELGISARQREQMEQEQQKAREEMRNNPNRPDFEALRNMSPEERRAQMEKMREQMQGQMSTFATQMAAKIEAVLTPAQQKRLSELDLQWRGPLALTDSKVASQMRLSPDQQRQITNIHTEYRTGQDEVRRSIMGSFGPGGRGQGNQGNSDNGGRPQFNPEEMRARMENMQKETEKVKKASSDKIVALLSAEQRQAWKSLQGKAFTFRAVN